VLDLILPDGDGLELIAALEYISPRTDVLITSARIDDNVLLHCRVPRVKGMIWKTTLINDHLKLAIAEIRQNRTFFSKEVLTSQLTMGSDPLAFYKILTKSELVIVKFIAEGHTDIEVSALIKCSPQTVKAHRLHIQRKVGVTSTAQLVSWAMRVGLKRSFGCCTR